MERYLLGLTIHGVIEPAALYRTLETIEALRPGPSYIVGLDFITHHSEATPKRTDLAELWSLCDKVVQTDRPRGTVLLPHHYKRAKCFFLRTAQELGLDAAFYGRAGDHWSPTAPAAMLRLMSEHPQVGWTFLQVIGCETDGLPRSGFAHRAQKIEPGKVRRTYTPLPGMMIRSSINASAIHDDAMLGKLGDTELMLSVLENSGLEGFGIKSDDDGLLFYYLTDHRDTELTLPQMRATMEVNADIHAARLEKLLKHKGLATGLAREVAKARRSTYRRACVIDRVQDMDKPPKHAD